MTRKLSELRTNNNDYYSNYKKRKKLSELEKEQNLDFSNVKITKGTSGFFQDSKYFDDGYQFGDVAKTTGASVGDLASDIGKGFMNTMEGVADWGQYRAADVLDLFGADKAAKAVKENAKFNSTGALFGENEDGMNITKKDWAKNLENKSVLGDTLDSVNQGVGNVVGMIGLGALTGGGAVGTALSSYTSAYGNARSEAYKNGADDKTANRTAMVSGLAEGISEQVFSGIPGLKTAGWGDKLVGKVGGGISKYLGTGTGKIAMKILDAGGEGAEEIISNMLQATGNDIIHAIDKNYTYGMENQTGNIFEDIGQAFTSKESWEAFLSASLTSALVNGGNNFITTAQKNSILKSYAKDNGISVKEAQTMLENTVQSETEYNKRAIELKNNKKMLFNDMIDMQDNIQKQELQNMKKDVFVESGQRDQAFQYKETGNEKVDTMYKSLSEVGNNTTESHEKAKLAEKMINDLGYDVEFTNNEKIFSKMSEEQKAKFEGKTINGFVKDGKMYLNVDSNNLASFTIGHETKHFFEKFKEENKSINDALIEFAKLNNRYDTDLAETTKMYTDKDGNVLGDPERELMADYTGEFFTNEDFVNGLSTKNPTILSKARTWFKELYYKATGQQEKLLLSKINTTIENAYRKMAQNKSNNSSMNTLENLPDSVISENKANIETKQQEQVNLPTMVETTPQVVETRASEVNLPIAEKKLTPAQAEQKIIAEQEKKSIEYAENLKKEIEDKKKANLPTQTKIKNNEGIAKIREKYTSASKINGSKDTIVLSDGTKLSGTYKLVEAGSLTASHNAETFEQTEYFPTTENGTTINDRDYSTDKNAQREVNKKAADYDGRAFADNGVIVSKDGIVVSGNDRTMSGDIAAKNNTDAKYIEYLKEKASQYGFTKEQIESMKHPRVALELNDDVVYDTNTFAKFNKDAKKSKSVSERAKEIGKTIDSNTITQISDIIDKFETTEELYNNETATRKLLNLLQEKGIIDSNNLAEIYDGNKLTGTGKDLFESVVLGSVISEDNAKYFRNNNDLKYKIMKTAPAIMQNKTLGDYTISEELNNAIETYKKANMSKLTIEEFTNQYNLFGDNNVDLITKRLAQLFETKGYKNLKNFMEKYNAMAELPASGQRDIFSQGEVETKNDILSKALNIDDNMEIQYSLSGINSNMRLDNRIKQKIAEKLDEKKVNANFIWAMTGWEKGVDGKWRYETSDPKMKDMKIKVGQDYNIAECVDAKELYRLYPKLKDLEFSIIDMTKNEIRERVKGIYAESDNGGKGIYLNKNLSPKEINQVLAHEMQHFIQEQEGFAGGASKEFYIENGKILSKNISEEKAYKMYRNTAGEVEARNVANRTRNSAIENKFTRPGLTQDTKTKDIIFAENVQKAADIVKSRNETKYSLSDTDNQGRTLSKNQQEYFKDSKVIDDNGNLITMYHGSPTGNFNTFNINKSGGNTLSAEHGLFFTDSKEFADEFSYEREKTDSMFFDKKGKKGQVYETYLNMKEPLDFSKLSKEDISNLYDYASDLGKLDGKEQFISNMENWQKIGNHQLMKGNIDLNKIDTDSNYDGVIAKLDVKGSEKEYIVFNSNQIKNVDNTNPTSNQDIRYSLSEDNNMIDDKTGKKVMFDVEPIKTPLPVNDDNKLMAIHNLSEEKMKGVIELGGFPVPSIAVTNPDIINHKSFGDISVIFDKSTIDPSNRKNEVYDRDVWSPTQPQIDYYMDSETLKNVANKLGIRDYDLEDYADNNKTPQYLSDRLTRVDEIVNKYVEDNNVKYETAYKSPEMRVEFHELSNDIRQFIIDNDLTVYKLAQDENLKNEYYKLIKDYYDNANLPSAVKENLYNEKINFLNEWIDTQKGAGDLEPVRGMRRYQDDFDLIKKGENQVVDEWQTQKNKREAAIANGLQDYLIEETAPLFKEKGIYNGKEYITASGIRRSFWQLHDEYNLENIVDAMTAGDTKGTQNWSSGFGQIQAQMANRFNSIEEIRNAENQIMADANNTRLVELREKLENDIDNLSDKYDDWGGMENASELIADFASQSNHDIETFRDLLENYYQAFGRITDNEINQIIDHLEELRELPTDYFEAKPQRAVGLNEIGIEIIPNTSSEEFKKLLQDNGIEYAEYDKSIEGDRQRVINEYQQYKFSLSNKGEEYQPKLYKGNDTTKLSDMKLQDKVNLPTSDNVNLPSADTGTTPEKEDSFKVRYNKQVMLMETKKKTLIDERAKLITYLKETLNDIDEKIKNKQNEYQLKKDKDTKVAQTLLQQVESLKTRKSNMELLYADKIDRLSNKITNFDAKVEAQKITRKEATAKNIELARTMLEDITDIKDKTKGIKYQLNTMKRNLRDIMTPERAKDFYDTYFKPITKNNAKSENFITSYNDRISKFNLNNAESTYTQMIGEKQWNPESKLTNLDLENYLSKNKSKIDTEKCNKAAEEFRTIYNELIDKINESLVKNGYKPIDYRKGYFPHFIEDKATSPLGKLAEKLGWNVKKGTLPTDIAGITDQFRPGKAWTSFSQKRTGDTTDYNALKGLDNYLRGAADTIYHTEDIQKLRALESEIRYQYSDKGIQDKIDAIYADDMLDSNEKYNAINQLVIDIKNNPLGNFATEIRNYTDNLANKKAFGDRSMEQSFGRDTYSIMQNVNSRVSANMVGANISSALTNFIPITQAWSQVSTKNLMRGMYESIKTSIKDDGFADSSVFLTNRTKQAERLYKTGVEKINDKLGIPFEAIDSFTANTLVRAKYYENLDKGMSNKEAINNADEFAKDVMAGRSKGDAPTIMNQKNPLMKLMTAFQLEVNNQFGYMFKDIPADMGGEAKEKIAMAFIKMFLGAFLYNQLAEKITGRKSAFSPIDMAIDDIKTATNDNMDIGEKLSTIATDTASELPFVGGMLGGGRLPIQASIPYNNPLEMVTSTISDAAKLFDEDENTKKTAIKNLVSEWSKPVYYVAMPFAGGQIKKTVDGLSMYNDNLPVAGSYTNSGKLRFEAPDDTLGKLQAAVFGQYASKNAREYFENGYKPLTEKQINTALDAGMNISDYRKYQAGLKQQDTNEDKISYISNLPLADEQKNVLANSVLNRKDNVDISDYGNYGSLEEFDYANKNPEKYSAITQITDYNSFKSYKSDIDDIKDKYTDTNARKAAIRNYINSLNLNKYQKMMLEKLGAGYSIKNYRSLLHDYINGLEMTKEEKETIDSALFGD